MIDIGWFSLVQDQTDDWFSHLWGCIWQWSHLDFNSYLAAWSSGMPVGSAQAYRPIAATNMALQVSFPTRVCGDTDPTCDFQAFWVKVVWSFSKVKLCSPVPFVLMNNMVQGGSFSSPGPTQVILCPLFEDGTHPVGGRAYHFEDLILHFWIL